MWGVWASSSTSSAWPRPPLRDGRAPPAYAALWPELEVGAVGHDLAALQEHHPLGQADGQRRGDDQGGATGDEAAQGIVDLQLDLHVDGAGGIVEDEDVGVSRTVRAMAMRWRCPPESV